MQKTRFMRCLSMLVLVIAMAISTAIPAFAADQDYNFSLIGDQTRSFHVYPYTSNTKVYATDPGTVKISSIGVPSGTGWAFKLYYRGHSYDSDALQDVYGNYYIDATQAAWARGAYTVHPSFLYGMAHKGWTYYVGGRLDDTVNDGLTYEASGTFNSDYT